MFDEILVCLDGSLFAERIIPYVRGIAASIGAKLTFVRVVEDEGEFATAENYVGDLAGRLGGGGKVKDGGGGYCEHPIKRVVAKSPCPSCGYNAWTDRLA